MQRGSTSTPDLHLLSLNAPGKMRFSFAAAWSGKLLVARNTSFARARRVVKKGWAEVRRKPSSSTKVLWTTILSRLANAGLDDYFRVVGTHALYAYEAAAGFRFASEITSARDIDLLWDTRKRVMFAQRLKQDSPSMLAALQKVDIQGT
jgi:hypothetical protein